MGSMRDARRAGYQPKRTPTAVETAKAVIVQGTVQAVIVNRQNGPALSNGVRWGMTRTQVEAIAGEAAAWDGSLAKYLRGRLLVHYENNKATEIGVVK